MALLPILILTRGDPSLKQVTHLLGVREDVLLKLFFFERQIKYWRIIIVFVVYSAARARLLVEQHQITTPSQVPTLNNALVTELLFYLLQSIFVDLEKVEVGWPLLSLLIYFVHFLLWTMDLHSLGQNVVNLIYLALG